MERDAHVRRTREEWQKIMAECEASGLSQSAFAKSQGLHPKTVSYWANKLGLPSRRRKAKTETLRTVPVTVLDGAPSRGQGVEIQYGGLHLIFPEGTDANYMGDVFLKLRAAC